MRWIDETTVALLHGARAGLPLRPRPRRRPELRIITWADYVPADLIAAFTKETGIEVEVTLSNNEEMISKLRATGVRATTSRSLAGRITSVERTSASTSRSISPRSRSRSFSPRLLDIVKRNATSTASCMRCPTCGAPMGSVVNTKHITKETPIADYPDLCRPYLQGKTSIRLPPSHPDGVRVRGRQDPFARYGNPKAYGELMTRSATR